MRRPLKPLPSRSLYFSKPRSSIFCENRFSVPLGSAAASAQTFQDTNNSVEDALDWVLCSHFSSIQDVMASSDSSFRSRGGDGGRGLEAATLPSQTALDHPRQDTRPLCLQLLSQPFVAFRRWNVLSEWD